MAAPRRRAYARAVVSVALFGALSVALLTALPSRAAGAAVDGVVITTADAAVTDLSGTWRVQAGDDPRYADPAYDDRGWQVVRVPSGLGGQGSGSRAGFFWYRLVVDTHAQALTQPLLRIGRIDSGYELFAGGRLVGRHSALTDGARVQFEEHRSFAVPVEAIDADGRLHLALRVWRSPLRASSNPGRGGVTNGPLLFGEAAAVTRAHLSAELPQLALFSVFLVVGLYHLQLFRRRRALREYLWFGAFSTLMSVYVLLETQWLYQLAPRADGESALPSAWLSRTSLACVFLLMPIFLQFLWPFLSAPVTRPWRVFQAASVAWAAVGLLWPTPWFMQRTLIVWEVLFLLPFLVAVVVLVVKQVRAAHPEARTIAIGVGLLLFTSLNNIARERELYKAPELSWLAFAGFVLAMAVSLANRFTRVYGDLDVKNAELEQMNRLKDELLASSTRMSEAAARFVPFEFLALLGKRTLVDVALGDQVQRDMSILFSDIRSFTSLVETHSAQENFRFINDYLSAVEPAITEHRGFVDSFVGDAIMALFDGDPAHQQHDENGGASDAVAAAVAMHRVYLPAFNALRAQAGAAPLAVGIGVNTGRLTCGTIGGRRHIKCGVIGDPVNLASRIEGMTKRYGAKVLLGEETQRRLPAGNPFALREVDRVQALGKRSATTLWEVLDAEPDDRRDACLAALPQYHAALQAYRARRFAEALELFRAVATRLPGDVPTALYIARAESLLRKPPPDAWDGVFAMDEK